MSSTSSRNASAASAGDRAFEWTRDRILRGELPGGSMISEGEVSAQVGVSRTPVREAFVRLETEGFLVLYPKRGAMVVPVTEADLRDMIEARLLVEPWAAEKAAGREDRAEIAAALRSSIDDLVEAHRRGDVATYQDSDREFHEVIVGSTGNALLVAFHRGLRDRQLRAGALALRTDIGRDAEIPVEHAQIADAIHDGRADAAASAARDHIVSTRRALLGGPTW